MTIGTRDTKGASVFRANAHQTTNQRGVKKRSRMASAAAAVLVTGSVLTVASAQVARADGPGVGAPWIVSVGDSYISGEGGRWAGNTNNSSTATDALGPTAYFDDATNTAETINRCHRSKAAEIHVGGGVNSLNLACSGAKTTTFTDSSGNFKPGLDFYSDAAGNKGQAAMLQSFAATNNVKMVVVSIGGNDFNFGSIVQTCVSNFLLSSSLWPNYCNDDSSVTANFTAANVSARTTDIAAAVNRVKQAMANAGYAAGSYSVVMQTYPSPLPTSSGFRYSQSGYSRQNTGGCGFWNNDANWANNTALPTINNAVRNGAAAAGVTTVIDLSATFNGRRLCENTVGLLEEKRLTSWTQATAVDKTEWIAQIRTVSTATSAYFIQESLHPNYWGELAIRNCVRQAWNGGTPRGGTCQRSANGLVNGEPVMTLV